MSMPSSLENSPVKTEDMLIGALLRVPAQAIHRRIINELNAAGFDGATRAAYGGAAVSGSGWGSPRHCSPSAPA